jgi:hypothetical protein
VVLVATVNQASNLPASSPPVSFLAFPALGRAADSVFESAQLLEGHSSFASPLKPSAGPRLPLFLFSAAAEHLAPPAHATATKPSLVNLRGPPCSPRPCAALEPARTALFRRNHSRCLLPCAQPERHRVRLAVASSLR